MASLWQRSAERQGRADFKSDKWKKGRRNDKENIGMKNGNWVRKRERSKRPFLSASTSKSERRRPGESSKEIEIRKSFILPAQIAIES